MESIKKLWLQLLADGDGGDGGDGAPGVDAGSQGQETMADRLRGLNVPEHIINRRQKKWNAMPQASAAAAQQEAEHPASAGGTEGQPTKMSLEEVLKVPEENEKFQRMFASRTKEAKAAKAQLDQIMPALKLVAGKYDMDPDSLDVAALAAKIMDDDGNYQRTADELGVSNDIAKMIEKQKAEANRERQARLQQENEAKYRAHFDNLQQQFTELQKTFPNARLENELNDARFRYYTSPQAFEQGFGMSVEEAYYMVHRKDIDSMRNQVVANTVQQKLSNSIRSGMSRPAEAGTSGRAPSVAAIDWRNATPEQRQAMRDEIHRRGKVRVGR